MQKRGNKMNYRYNLDAQQAEYIKTGDKMVIVVPLKKQPPDGYTLRCPLPYGNKWWIFSNNLPTEDKDYDEIKIDCQYPLASRVELRETWGYGLPLSGHKYVYKSDLSAEKYIAYRAWLSAQCMPHEAINQRGNWGIVEDVSMDDGWKKNPWYEIVTLRKGEIWMQK